MHEASLFLMFTQPLNTLGVAYMVSGSVAVIIIWRAAPNPRCGFDRGVGPYTHCPATRGIPAGRLLLPTDRVDRAGSGARTTRALQNHSPRDRFQGGRLFER